LQVERARDKKGMLRYYNEMSVGYTIKINRTQSNEEKGEHVDYKMGSRD